jgi:hypothetical protein
LTVVLRNDDGRYNTLGSGTYEAIKLGSEVTFSPGYIDAGGTVRVSDGPSYWITGWDRVRDAGRSTFVLHAVDGWGLLQRWRARRQFLWQAEELNIFNLLRYVHARAGLEMSSWGTLSAETLTHKPAFTISPGERGDTAIERLLRKTHEVSLFRGYSAYIKQPKASDSSDYTYGTDHAVLQASHGQQIKPLNRAQVTGDVDASVFTEDFDWPELELVGDIIAQVSDVYLDSAERTHRLGDALLRHADIEGLTGRMTVPLNCGQELYDVVTITDSLCGLSAAKRRVLGLTHLYDSRKAIYHLRIALGDV